VPNNVVVYLTSGLYTGRIETARDFAPDAVHRKSITMVQVDSSQTNPTLLRQVRDWGDDPAWKAFFACYQPLLRGWCQGIALEGDDGDELCQRIWVELMTRMQTFNYDPGRGFRRWLWRLFRSRAVDLLRARRAARHCYLDGIEPPVPRELRADWRPGTGIDDDGAGGSQILLEAAAAAQKAVRQRVESETWRAYWLIAIEDKTVREAADSLGKRYTAVYNGYRRVERMLRAQGQARLGAAPS
jgi:RNA polymerase sigma factor (sigma-70 family)